ncbi:hypothetical protein [Agaribacterium sp. ZY112]|uniref:hypothetical protein n=1 Tax=Agaribacterium sp. ZY112 TaxID=3233574 RepID=UPI0035236BC5
MEQILLVVHVLTGGISIFAGFSALIANKGAFIHRYAGRVFNISILITGVSIIALGVNGKDLGDMLGGLSLIYFTATAYRAIQLQTRSLGAIDFVLFLCVLWVCLANVYLSFHVHEWSLEYPALQYIVVAFIHLIAAVGDAFLLLKQRVSRQQRLLRHSWRMCLVLFMASGSFFLGQMKLFPQQLTEQGFWFFFIPPLLTLVYMGYWLVRLSLALIRKEPEKRQRGQANTE